MLCLHSKTWSCRLLSATSFVCSSRTWIWGRSWTEGWRLTERRWVLLWRPGRVWFCLLSESCNPAVCRPWEKAQSEKTCNTLVLAFTHYKREQLKSVFAKVAVCVDNQSGYQSGSRAVMCVPFMVTGRPNMQIRWKCMQISRLMLNGCPPNNLHVFHEHIWVPATAMAHLNVVTQETEYDFFSNPAAIHWLKKIPKQYLWIWLCKAYTILFRNEYVLRGHLVNWSWFDLIAKNSRNLLFASSDSEDTVQQKQCFS